MKLSYKCRECGEDINTNTVLVRHLAQHHKIQPKEYYEKYIKQEGEGKCAICGKDCEFIDMKHGYRKYCSKECQLKSLASEKETITHVCAECGYTITGTGHLGFIKRFQSHLKNTHNNLSIKDYYDKHLKKFGEGTCPGCGKPTSFDSFFRGYSKYCSGLCAANTSVQKEQKIEEEIKARKEDFKAKQEAYTQELKDRVHEFDWEGDRNTWAGGHKTHKYGDKDNLLTDNSLSYMDGQEYQAKTQTIVDNEEQCFDDVFWM